MLVALDDDLVRDAAGELEPVEVGAADVVDLQCCLAELDFRLQRVQRVRRRAGDLRVPRQRGGGVVSAGAVF